MRHVEHRQDFKMDGALATPSLQHCSRRIRMTGAVLARAVDASGQWTGLTPLRAANQTVREVCIAAGAPCEHPAFPHACLTT